MAWDQLLTGVLSSVASGSVLLIATLGLAVVFGLMGVVNLAHGEFIMFGAYAALTAVRAGVPFPLAVALAALAAAAFGALVEWLIVRRLHGRPFDTLLAMWGLSLALYQSAVLLFGTVTPGIGMPASNVRIGDYTISSYLLFLIVVAAVLIAAVYALLTRTNYGLMARAAIQDPATAAAMGVRTVRINNLTFAWAAVSRAWPARSWCRPCRPRPAWASPSASRPSWRWWSRARSRSRAPSPRAASWARPRARWPASGPPSRATWCSS